MVVVVVVDLVVVDDQSSHGLISLDVVTGPATEVVVVVVKEEPGPLGWLKVVVEWTGAVVVVDPSTGPES